jgi:CRISPR-associated protein Cas1
MLQGSGITVTTNLLTELLDADVGVFLADDRGRPAAILHAANGVRAERMAEQAEAVFGKRGARIARQIVRGKLRNQRNLLRTRLDYQREADPKTAAILEAAIAGIEEAEAKLKALPKASVPLTREDRDVLMGFEGLAARHYWDGVKALVADEAIFPGRRYPNAEDAVNCALNYGYGILYQRVERAILTSGLSPRLGMLHAPRRKANALTFDMVEEYRAYFVDRAVLAMVTRGESMAVDRRGRLTDDTRRLVAQNVLERVNLPTVYRSQRLILDEILAEQLRLLTKAFIGEEPYRAFIGRW